MQVLVPVLSQGLKDSKVVLDGQGQVCQFRLAAFNSVVSEAALEAKLRSHQSSNVPV